MVYITLPLKALVQPITLAGFLNLDKKNYKDGMYSSTQINIDRFDSTLSMIFAENYAADKTREVFIF
jgi:hypothetical protein